MDSKTLLRALVGVVLIAGGGLAFRSYTARGEGKSGAAAPAGSAGGKDADRVVPVLTTPVVQRDMPIYLDGLGNVIAVATVTVRSLVDGRVDHIAFTEGQEVHKGDLLAQIDPRPFANQLHVAQAAAARDQAQLVGNKRTYERQLALIKEGLSSQQAVDDASVAVHQLEGTVAGDAANIDVAKLQLDYAHITSPIDGVTGVRLVDQGNIVHPSDPTGIVVLTQLDPIAVIFTLPQDDLMPIQKERAQGPIKVEAISRDGVTKLATGELLLIDNQINTSTATIKLKALFPNPDRALWPNAFVKTRLLLSVHKGALVVPSAVVQRGPQGTFVYVVDADGKAQVKPVTVDITEGDTTILASGVAAGEQVVVEGQYQLRPGSKVSVTPKAAADAKPAGGGKPSGTGKAVEGKAGAPAKSAQ